MNLIRHISANTIAAFILVYYLKIDRLQVVIFIAASVLIDLDHVLNIILKYRTLSIKKGIKRP